MHISALAGGAREIRNVLEKLPKRLQPRAKAMLHEIMQAPNRESAGEEIARFAAELEAHIQKQ